MKKFLGVTQKAANDTARFMTGQLRHHALNEGWHPDVVANMHVEFNGGEFKVKVHPDYSDRAFIHEFGDETRKPTAVIRKFTNNTQVAEQVFHMSMSKHWGEAK